MLSVFEVNFSDIKRGLCSRICSSWEVFYFSIRVYFLSARHVKLVLTELLLIDNPLW